MDAAGLSDEVRIEGADNNAGVPRAFLMEADEVFPVDCEDSPVLRRGAGEHLFIRHAQAGLSGFLNGQHIMAEAPELEDDGEREVLVGVEAGHA